MVNLEVGNCADCPMVIDTADQLQALCKIKERITELAVDDRIDNEVAPAVMNALRGMPELGERIMPTIPRNEQEIAADFRKGAAAVLEQLDEQEELITRATNTTTSFCDGPLKMRATKSGTTITATVCNHPFIPAGQHIEPTVIKRT